MKNEKPIKITKKYIKKRFGIAWKLHSKFVRERDSGICISCGIKDEPKNMNAGHFIHKSLDLDLMNINTQCVRCNKWLHGNLGMYCFNLIKKYGMEAVEDLIKRANEFKGYSIEEIEEVIKKYGGKKCS